MDSIVDIALDTLLPNGDYKELVNNEYDRFFNALNEEFIELPQASIDISKFVDIGTTLDINAIRNWLLQRLSEFNLYPSSLSVNYSDNGTIILKEVKF
jgi:hypothetical protein